MGGNYLMYVCMYVCMYTMILPLHFSVPIYSPWQKKKKKKTQKIKRGAGPLPGPESIYLSSLCMYIVAYIAARIYRGWHESQECAIFKLR